MIPLAEHDWTLAMERIDLNTLNFRAQGRAAQPLVAEVVRELTEDDLASTQLEGRAKTEGIRSLRDRHHALAKALVDGIGETEAGIICGYTPSRVSILKADKTFQELMSFYRLDKAAGYREMHEKLAGLGSDAVDEITERLENEPEEISMGQLLEISKLALDRSGFGPQSSVQVNHKVGLADKLELARKRALQAQRPMLDITPDEESS